MTDQEALDIVQALVEGVDPFTNEPLAVESVCVNPAVNTALNAASQALESKIKAAARRASLPSKAGAPWDETEAQLVLQAYEAGDSIKEIAARQQRTQGAIRSRLVKLGVLELA